MRIVRACAPALLVAMASLAAAAQAATPLKQTITIPAQALEPALQTLAKQRNLQVIYRSEVVGELRTAGVTGQLTTREALRQLLAGTGLTYEYIDDNTVTIISSAASTSQSSQPAESTPISPADKAQWLQKADDSHGLHVAQSGTTQSTGSSRSAADASAEKSDASAEDRVEEIVVTAQKRAEHLIDVPLSATVLTANDLAKLGATQFRDFANTVPGLSFATTGAGQNSISLRGVTTGFDVSPTVGVYVDEVPIGSGTAYGAFAQIGLDVGLFDLDRIEVLRGPQGTLYGASTMGGLLKYVTQRPDPGRFAGTAQAGVSGTEDGGLGYNFAGTMNMPLRTDTAALRTSAFYSHDGGYVDDLALNRDDVNQSDIYGGRADLLLTPMQGLSIRLTAFAQNISRDGEGTVDYTYAGGKPYGSLGQGRLVAEPFEEHFRLFSGTVVYELGPTTLTAASGYQTLRKQNVLDISVVYVPLLQTALGRSYGAMGYDSRNEVEKFTQEIRLAGESGRPLEWTVGAFFTHETSEAASTFLPRTSAGAPAPNDLYSFRGPASYEEYAGFGDVTWHLTSKFDVTGGVRYAKDDQEFTQIGAGVLIASRPLTRASEDVFTYLANARYQFNDRATAYLRYATGYRPGGPNIAANDPATGLPLGSPTFDADRLKSYEAGFKVQSASGAFGIDVAGYYGDWSNIQLIATRGGLAFRANAPGGATVRGVELAAAARPLRGLEITGAFNYQQAELSEANADLRAAKGERLPGVPRFTGALNADYTMLSSSLRPTFGVTARQVSERRAGFDAGVGSARQYILPEYTTVDLRAGLTFGTVRSQLYVHNLFDEHGQLSNMYPQFGARIAILQPRTVGINLLMPF